MIRSWQSPTPPANSSAPFWSVLVHGGAGDVPLERRAAHAAGCEAAAKAAGEQLAKGASALNAAICAVQYLEDDPLFNAGTGGALNERGELELDASIMCGNTLQAGAVSALRGYKNPVHIAHAALKHGEHVFYTAEGAALFAERRGFKTVDEAQLITRQAKEKLRETLASGSAKHWAGGTVGAVVRDAFGHLAAATSTGGTLGKHPGRVGDSPIIGAGAYADDTLGAASATGHGEGILRAVTSFRATAQIANRGVEGAATTLVEELNTRWSSPAGLILVGPDGCLGWARSTATMSWAAQWAEHDAVSGF